MIPQVSITDFEFFTHPTRTRFPFRYGIASMTDLPHLFVRVRLSVDGVEGFGLASEGLPPKWFTKDPATTFDQDLPTMLEVIDHAAQLTKLIAVKQVTFFELWKELYRLQSLWTAECSLAPLLTSLGVSFIERAVLDGLCRALSKPMHQVVLENLLDLRLGEVHPELANGEPRDLLPAQPLDSIRVRHTVGLADPLTAADIPDDERLNDGLPHDLESCIRTYGLTAFKIKLSGDAERDLDRLRRMQDLLDRETAGRYISTLDGNENFKSFGAFREFWTRVENEPSLTGLVRNIVVIEQPVHRDQALSEDAGEELRAWNGHPPLIIDESDGAVGDLPRALSLGYDGTSHKNCKGIVKGIANACLIEHRRRHGDRVVLTGEDLANIGPVALLQDLAMMSLLGIEHVERNGHHYFRGLSTWLEEWQREIVSAHGDLYELHAQEFAALRIRNGRIELGSVNAAPFGVAPLFDPAAAGIGCLIVHSALDAT